MDGFSPRVWTTQKTKLANINDFIFSVRAPVGSVGKTSYSVVIGRGVAAIRGNEFIYQTLLKKDIEGYWKRLSSGSTFDSINSDSLINTEIMQPLNIEEQSKIATYLENIDNLITL